MDIKSFTKLSRPIIGIYDLFIPSIIRTYSNSELNIYVVKKQEDMRIDLVMLSMYIQDVYTLDNIDIIWSGSAIKEFTYVPTNHYLEHQEDILLLKTMKFKFKSNF